jgi:hypothetical protein
MNPARHHPHRNRSAACIFVDIYKRLVLRSNFSATGEGRGSTRGQN